MHPGLLPVLPLLLVALTARAAMTEEEMFFKGVADVNDGELKFLAAPPPQAVHHHTNHLTLSASSLVDGWIGLAQCHRHIDPVPSSQIVYGEGRIRDLRITRIENIEKAWVQDNSVQMEHIHPNALICIEAQSRALLADGPDAWVLRNGPYLRRFLDGFYPMRVTQKVDFRAANIAFDDIHPDPQPGFQVSAGEGELTYEASFEGALVSHIRFVRKR